MHRSLLFAVLSLSVLLSTLVAAQDASYTFTIIDGPSATWTEGIDINKQGQIVGGYRHSQGEDHSFLYEGGVFTPFPLFPGSIVTRPFGINVID
jgi:probable HAF family extracellular repeat protein